MKSKLFHGTFTKKYRVHVSNFQIKNAKKPSRGNAPTSKKVGDKSIATSVSRMLVPAVLSPKERIVS